MAADVERRRKDRDSPLGIYDVIVASNASYPFMIHQFTQRTLAEYTEITTVQIQTRIRGLPVLCAIVAAVMCAPADLSPKLSRRWICIHNEICL